MRKERIGLDDTIGVAMHKMSEGNPGALTVLMRIMEEGQAIDPQGLAGGHGAILALDTLGIYGAQIWMLYKDVCGENIEHTLGVLRAWQLGGLTKSALLAAVNNYGQGIDVAALVAGVKARLPEFGAKDAASVALV